ncbi:VanZ family protein [Cohnella thailandensis]|uniref:VanZ family protein n=1 Tax=Cohnella thailandensis TaxID=557557 RepID=A0A841SYA0_9BACL|nr:VanZ family protein [Cohnella thailandensis]MBB6637203.1 VanZ family protein [Cohnella thailandensis]MBP1976975.1 glycopeptide antibiotics resistance protein [Cohnella thailandensis]
MKANKPSVQLIVLLVSILYFYLLVKIILFKFGSPDPSFLLGQLRRLAENPGRLLRGLELGNLVPGYTIRQNIDHLSNGTDKLNFFGNIALFVPAGILIRIGLGRRLLLAVLISFAVSLGLEISQLVLMIGTFDVDDLILNTSGGLIGYLLIRMAEALDAPFHRKAKEEKQASSAPRLL